MTKISWKFNFLLIYEKNKKKPKHLGIKMQLKFDYFFKQFKGAFQISIIYKINLKLLISPHFFISQLNSFCEKFFIP